MPRWIWEACRWSRSFWAQTRLDLRDFFDGPKLAPWRAILGFLAQNAENHVQIMANIVWIVIYALPRSFWAQTRRDLREFFDGPKLAPFMAILGFWPKTLEIMYKTLLILYESWSRSARDHSEPKLASIWETFLTAQNWLLGGPFWVFGPKRWKSCTKHCKYCMNRDLRHAGHARHRKCRVLNNFLSFLFSYSETRHQKRTRNSRKSYVFCFWDFSIFGGKMTSRILCQSLALLIWGI